MKDDAPTVSTSSPYFVIRWPLAFFGIPYTDTNDWKETEDGPR